MKKLLALIYIMLTITCSGQINETSKIGLYIWKEVVTIEPCKLNGDSLNDQNSEIVTKTGQKFRVLKVLGDKAIIQILDYPESITKRNNLLKKNDNTSIKNIDFYKYNFTENPNKFLPITENYNFKEQDSYKAYFKVEIKKLEDSSIREQIIGGSLAAGVINFPFKLRIQKGNTDFSGAFNFGAGIGYKFRQKSWRTVSHSIISGYSISNIVLDSSNTNTNQGKLASTNNFSAFSLSLGYLIEYQKVQAGIFIGWDHLTKINQREFDWQYQMKPWISIGFGMAIFSGQKEKPNNNPNETN